MHGRKPCTLSVRGLVVPQLAYWASSNNCKGAILLMAILFVSEGRRAVSKLRLFLYQRSLCPELPSPNTEKILTHQDLLPSQQKPIKIAVSEETPLGTVLLSFVIENLSKDLDNQMLYIEEDSPTQKFQLRITAGGT